MCGPEPLTATDDVPQATNSPPLETHKQPVESYWRVDMLAVDSQLRGATRR